MRGWSFVAICDSLRKDWSTGRKNRLQEARKVLLTGMAGMDLSKADQGQSSQFLKVLEDYGWKWTHPQLFTCLSYFCKEVSFILQVKNNNKIKHFLICYAQEGHQCNTCVMKAKVTTSESRSILALFGVHQGTQLISFTQDEGMSGTRLLWVEFCPPPPAPPKNPTYIEVLTPQHLRM